MLSDLRVIDLTRLLPGPYATWLLAGLGADVVKVEQPGRGDYIRGNWPRRGDTSTVFHLFNRGKRLVSLDLKQHEGRAALLDLVRDADALVEGFRPGVMDRLGLGWDTLHAHNPRLVVCALTGFGQDSPYRTRVGHDINYLSLAGLEDGLRDERGKPVAARFQIADMAGGALTAVVGILAAVHEARRTGEGRFVDAAMTDAVFPFQGLRLAEELIPGETAPSDREPEAGHDSELGSYETADGRYVTLDPYELAFKERLWEIIEREELGERPPAGATREEVRTRLAAIVRKATRDRWVELLGHEEVCFAPVYTLAELADDPHVAARGLLGDALDPAVVSPTLGFPLRFDPAQPVPPAEDWRIGAHTVAVLQELGWDDERIAAAAAIGAIAVAEERAAT